MFFASRISSKNDFTAIAETFTVEDGAPIKVEGFVLTNKAGANASDYTMTIKNGSTTISVIKLFGRRSFHVDIPFIADAGLSFTLDALSGAAATDVSVTVFHYAPGGFGRTLKYAPRISAKSDFSSEPETFTIEDGNPIRVMGVILSHNLDDAFQNSITVLMKNGSTTIGSYEMAARSDSHAIAIPFLADDGLSFVLEATTNPVAEPSDFAVTVFHTSPGA